ncbi:UNVERIFIED_CONTAM: hypothetical protein NCL1_37174 [Trichonephila clavipes]
MESHTKRKPQTNGLNFKAYLRSLTEFQNSVNKLPKQHLRTHLMGGGNHPLKNIKLMRKSKSIKRLKGI